MMRVLVVGDPSSSMPYVGKKLSALHAKAGPFALSLLTYPPSASADPSDMPAFPIPTFYASQHAPSTPAPSLTNVGPAAALAHSSLNILLIAAGYDDPPSAATPHPPEIVTALTQAGTMGAGFRGVDILIAPTPPRGVSVVLPEDVPCPSGLLARIAAAARPRYHFCGSAKFVELAPFVVPGAVAATRLLGIAPACKAKKGVPKAERWLYAADVQPVAAMTVLELAATRAGMLVTCPYDDGARKRVSEARSTSGSVSKRPRRASDGGRQSTATPRDAKCWFCLASGKDAHLVLAIGEHFYVAAAKGGLVPEHVLIVPVNHLHSSMDAEVTEDMQSEVILWKSAIRRWYKDEFNAEAYFFERAVYTRGGRDQMHMHIQCIPIFMPLRMSGCEVVESVSNGWNMNYVEIVVDGLTCLERLKRLCEESGEKAGKSETSFEYFWGELPDGTCVVQSVTAGKRLVAERATDADAAAAEDDLGTGPDVAREKQKTSPEHLVRRPGGHPLQFGRKIATVLLDLPDRVDWKSCVGTLREEQRAADGVRTSFSPFEPPEFDAS
jgi:diadenosine tetraphosphate (Ap4A) HIT family hydrolase